MKTIGRVICAVLLCLVVSGCTGVNEIRKVNLDDPPNRIEPVDVANMRDFDCRTGGPVSNKTDKSSPIEDYGKYWLSFVEYDDQGWSYSKQKQLKKLEERLSHELNDPKYKMMDFELIVFIHGWHHNAYNNDCNVLQFRTMLKKASDRYEEEFKNGQGHGDIRHERRVVGVYVGWRGESLDAPGLKYLTFLDRRFTAEHVAKGEVRELFAALHKLENDVNGTEKPKDLKDPRRHKLRSMVIGHSFGGLIAFHGVSQGMLDTLVMEKRESVKEARQECLVEKTWPDQLVLINPAFEASRFEPFHNIMLEKGCRYPAGTRPNIIVVTADNDWATGWVFSFVRHLLAVFERYGDNGGSLKEDEKAANLHAIGFVHRYRTHRICRLQNGTTVLAFSPSSDVSDHKELDRWAPVWVIGAPPSIVNGHDGFLYVDKGSRKLGDPVLLEWLLEIHSGKNPNHDLPTDYLAADSACDPWPN